MGRSSHGRLARGVGWAAVLWAIALLVGAPALADGGGPSAASERSRPLGIERSWIGGVQTDRSPVVSGHGWLVLPDATVGEDGQKALLVHLPPRTEAADQWGMVRPVTTVGGRVAAAAWDRERLYLLMQPEGQGESASRRVFALQALRGPSLFYEYVPEGRVEVLPTLAGPGELAGIAATERGPAVLLVAEKAGRRVPRLYELAGSEWREADGPWMAGETQWRPECLASGHVQLLPGRDGVQVLTEGREAEEWDVWASMARSVTKVGPNESGTFAGWSRRSVSRRCDDGTMLPAWPDVIRFVRGRSASQDALLVAWWDGSEVVLASVGNGRGGRSKIVGRFAGMPRPPATIVFGMDAPESEGAEIGTLAFVWPASGGTGVGGGVGEPNSESALMVREVLATGKEMYSGPARLGSLVRRVQYQALALLLVLVMVGVLVFVLRGDPQVVPVLPKGVGLADPMRRLVAAVLDFVPSAALVGIVEGRGALALLTPDTMLSGPGPGGSPSDIDLLPLGLAVAVTIMHATLGEWLFGRSLGKMLVGIRVVSNQPRGSPATAGGSQRDLALVRPKLWQALVRNVVRWVVSPLAMFAVLDVAGRHPGDLAGRTLVVMDAKGGSETG